MRAGSSSRVRPASRTRDPRSCGPAANVGRSCYAIDMGTSASVRRATAADAEALAQLVNRAYAVESFFVDGDRTDAAELVEMMERGTFLVLDHADQRGLAAAVYVTIEGTRGYFGMLAVGHGLQGRGIGKRLVRIAEAVAEAAGCTTMTMKIVNLREELGRWYRSLGYRETG